MVLLQNLKTPDYIFTHSVCVPAGTWVNSVTGFREFVSLILVVENQILWPSFIGGECELRPRVLCMYLHVDQ